MLLPIVANAIDLVANMTIVDVARGITTLLFGVAGSVVGGPAGLGFGRLVGLTAGAAIGTIVGNLACPHFFTD